MIIFSEIFKYFNKKSYLINRKIIFEYLFELINLYFKKVKNIYIFIKIFNTVLALVTSLEVKNQKFLKGDLQRLLL